MIVICVQMDCLLQTIQMQKKQFVQQWKFVIRDEIDEHLLRELLKRFPLFKKHQLPIILQPEGDLAISNYPTALAFLAERVRDSFWNDYYVRVLPQLHIIVWGRKKLV